MRTLIMAVLVTLIALPSFAASEPKTEDQKTLYAVGLVMARQLTVFELTPEELDLAIKHGCVPVSLGDTVLKVETAAIAAVALVKFLCRN